MKNLAEVVLFMNQIISWQMSFINQLLKNLRKVYSSFRGNIWGLDLADMQSLSKYNKGDCYLLCAIDLFSKYAWVVSLKDIKGLELLMHLLFLVTMVCVFVFVWYHIRVPVKKYLSKHDTLLHKTHTKVTLVLRYQWLIWCLDHNMYWSSYSTWCVDSFYH